MDEYYVIISKDGKIKGKGYEEEDLQCPLEGCKGTQYRVEWEEGTTTIVCGKGLKWIDEQTAQIE